jgi:hypothetical protein
MYVNGGGGVRVSARASAAQLDLVGVVIVNHLYTRRHYL